VGGFTFMGYRAVRSANHVRSHLHCAKCKHTLLSADRAKSCPECGTSLAEAGSVRSSESRLLVVRWLLGFVSRRGYAVFGWWRIIVGSIALVALLIGHPGSGAL
jgi:hypothetical protein